MTYAQIEKLIAEKVMFPDLGEEQSEYTEEQKKVMDRLIESMQQSE